MKTGGVARRIRRGCLRDGGGGEGVKGMLEWWIGEILKESGNNDECDEV
jgi:hypothetical protein